MEIASSIVSDRSLSGRDLLNIYGGYRRVAHVERKPGIECQVRTVSKRNVL